MKPLIRLRLDAPHLGHGDMGAQSDTSPRPLRVHARPGHAGGGGGGAGVGNQVVAVDGAARCSEWSLPILPHVRRVSHHHEVIFVLRPELLSRASGRAGSIGVSVGPVTPAAAGMSGLLSSRVRV